MICGEQIDGKVPFEEFSDGVDDLVETLLHGVHDTVEVRLSLECLKGVVVYSSLGEVFGNYGNILQTGIMGG